MACTRFDAGKAPAHQGFATIAIDADGTKHLAYRSEILAPAFEPAAAPVQAGP
jgi:hypothetical protein